jgi:hypothetical protein
MGLYGPWVFVQSWGVMSCSLAVMPLTHLDYGGRALPSFQRWILPSVMKLSVQGYVALF